MQYDRLLGVIIILAVALLVLRDSNNHLEQRASELRERALLLDIERDILETNAALQYVAPPVMPEPEPIQYIGIVSAYNMVESQTDSSPCIAADNSNICELSKTGQCIVANNKLPLGTIINLDGFGTCTVRDRMNPRYDGRYLDVLMGKDIRAAKQWGVREVAYWLVK